jgi:hypothetical protein
VNNLIAAILTGLILQFSGISKADMQITRDAQGYAYDGWGRKLAGYVTGGGEGDPAVFHPTEGFITPGGDGGNEDYTPTTALTEVEKKMLAAGGKPAFQTLHDGRLTPGGYLSGFWIMPNGHVYADQNSVDQHYPKSGYTDPTTGAAYYGPDIGTIRNGGLSFAAQNQAQNHGGDMLTGALDSGAGVKLLMGLAGGAALGGSLPFNGAVSPTNSLMSGLSDVFGNYGSGSGSGAGNGGGGGMFEDIVGSDWSSGIPSAQFSNTTDFVGSDWASGMPSAQFSNTYDFNGSDWASGLTDAQKSNTNGLSSGLPSNLSSLSKLLGSVNSKWVNPDGSINWGGVGGSAASMLPTALTTAYAMNQNPGQGAMDWQSAALSQFNPSAMAGLYDIQTGIGREGLTSNLASRGVTGSSFGNDALTNYSTTRDVGRQALINQGFMAGNTIANNLSQEQIQAQQIKNQLLGAGLYSAGIAANPNRGITLP